VWPALAKVYDAFGPGSAVYVEDYLRCHREASTNEASAFVEKSNAKTKAIENALFHIFSKEQRLELLLETMSETMTEMMSRHQSNPKQKEKRTSAAEVQHKEMRTRVEGLHEALRMPAGDGLSPFEEMFLLAGERSTATIDWNYALDRLPSPPPRGFAGESGLYKDKGKIKITPASSTAYSPPAHSPPVRKATSPQERARKVSHT
jgi:hypothetical protein